LGRSSRELSAAASRYVCVRVTDMRAIDVHNLRFDFDLTFALVLMHSDGTIYHRYGGRGPDHANSHLSLASLAKLLEESLADHAAYDRNPAPPRAAEPMAAIDLPALQRRIKPGQQIECVHCHTVNDAEHEDAVLGNSWKKDDLYNYPDPARLGLTLDTERQNVVTAVAPGSAAAAAGLRAGDEVVALGEQACVRTLSDVQWALHRAPFAATKLDVRYRRDGAEHAATLALPEAWKRCPPEEYAWRPFKWNLSPSSGFGGSELGRDAKKKLGLDENAFAFRVDYIVDWGKEAHRGNAAKAAGLRKGDVLVSFAGKSDFRSVPHFHAWVSLTRTAGEDTEFVVMRGKEQLALRYKLPE
jgi:hypothetical protein